MLCEFGQSLAQHENHSGLVWLDARSNLVQLHARFTGGQLDARSWGAGRGARVVDQRLLITGHGAIIVRLAHGKCKLGVSFGRVQTVVSWRLYLRFCIALLSLTELVVYCFEGRCPVAAWFLLSWGGVADVALLSTAVLEVNVGGAAAGVGLSLGSVDHLSPVLFGLLGLLGPN